MWNFTFNKKKAQAKIFVNEIERLQNLFEEYIKALNLNVKVFKVTSKIRYSLCDDKSIKFKRKLFIGPNSHFYLSTNIIEMSFNKVSMVSSKGIDYENMTSEVLVFENKKWWFMKNSLDEPLKLVELEAEKIIEIIRFLF